MGDAFLAATIGLMGGIMLGLAARFGRFCTLGAIEDAIWGQDFGRIRMWALALAIAISGTFLSAEAGLFSFEKTIYAASSWNPLASVVGGLIFGYGMAIAGNCGFGALARLGGGDLRSFLIVIVMGIAAYMTLNGPLAPLRVALFPPEPAWPGADQFGYAHWIAARLEVPVLLPALIVAAGFGAFALASPAFRRSPSHVIWGAVVGLSVLIGWIGTSWVNRESFEAIPVESHSFTAPLGETILYVMTSTGSGVSFSIGSVAGVLVGSVVGALLRGHFRWEACDDARELGRQTAGGALMGIGGVIAIGCSVGQGLTAFSTLAFSAPVVLVSIVIGASLGLRQLIRGFGPAE